MTRTIHTYIPFGGAANHNIDDNPLFVDADGPDYIVGTEDDNLRLSAGSPCIDAGDNTAVPGSVMTDLDGNQRIRGTVDMGAYEWGVVIYVDDTSPGPTRDGSNWTYAYLYLQQALDKAGIISKPVEIRVAKGTYKPGVVGEQTATFQLINDVAIYGGYRDGGGTWQQRNPATHETKLSGDLADNDNPVNFANYTENSYHVVTGSSTNDTTVLDGFTITGGAASNWGGGMYNVSGSPTVNDCTFRANTANWEGGGMYNKSGSSPTVTNCTFTGNRQGGMFNDHASPTVTGCMFTADNRAGMVNTNTSSPKVTNCTFKSNWSGLEGGGMVNSFSSDPKLVNCTFTCNHASSGGGIYNLNYSSPTVTNCTFTGNTATGGGAMFNMTGCDPTLTNCTFTKNSAGSTGGAIHSRASSPKLINCILWDDTASVGGNEIVLTHESIITVDYCDVQGGADGIYDVGLGNTINWGSGNIDDDPKFVRTPDPGPDDCWCDNLGTGGDESADDDYGDLHLKAGVGSLPHSPCINTGDPCYSPTPGPAQEDIDGDDRIFNNRVDMGSDEVIWDEEQITAGNTETLNPSAPGTTGDPTEDALVRFNATGGPADVTAAEMSSNPQPEVEGFQALDKTLRVDTSLDDGDFFMTVMIPFTEADLNGLKWDTLDLRWFKLPPPPSGSWPLAVEANTKYTTNPDPKYDEKYVGERHTYKGTPVPTLSSYLGDYGVFWNPNPPRKGFVWANVDHVTVFAAAVLLGDFEPDGDVDLADFANIAAWWLETTCNEQNYRCEGADIDGDGNVDRDDLLEFIGNWLVGK